MKRELYEIWEASKKYPFKEETWCAQMVDYVAYFPSERAALAYVESVRKYRAEHGTQVKVKGKK